MKLHFIDFFIIIIYLSSTILIGAILSKRASKSKESYFLGGNKLPWYMLGLSNASGMFDISGTMWRVTLAFVYGLKSIWIPWLWPVFNQIFLMVFLSAWLRRSNVTTGAQWIETRFGKGKVSYLPHGIVVVFARAKNLLNCGKLQLLICGIKGKFEILFMPFHLTGCFFRMRNF